MRVPLIQMQTIFVTKQPYLNVIIFAMKQMDASMQITALPIVYVICILLISPLEQIHQYKIQGLTNALQLFDLHFATTGKMLSMVSISIRTLVITLYRLYIKYFWMKYFLSFGIPIYHLDLNLY